MKYRITLTCKSNELLIGTTVRLVKEPHNEHDDEAIRCEYHTGKVIGGIAVVDRCYVANYYKTRIRGTISAGRLYDKVPDSCEAVIVEDRVAEVELPTGGEWPNPKGDAE